MEIIHDVDDPQGYGVTLDVDEDGDVVIFSYVGAPDAPETFISVLIKPDDLRRALAALGVV